MLRTHIQISALFSGFEKPLRSTEVSKQLIFYSGANNDNHLSETANLLRSNDNTSNDRGGKQKEVKL